MKRLNESDADDFQPYLNVTARKTTFSTLLDTGNLLGNLMSEKLFKALKYSPDQLTVSDYTGSAIQGSPLHILGQFKRAIPFTIPGIDGTFHHRPVVVRGLGMNLNLSSPWLKEYGARIDFATNELSFPTSSGRVVLEDHPVQGMAAAVLPTPAATRVFSRKEVLLQPQRVHRVTIGPQGNWASEWANQELTFEGHNLDEEDEYSDGTSRVSHPRPYLVTGQAFVHTNERAVCSVLVVNPTNQCVSLKKGALVGALSKHRPPPKADGPREREKPLSEKELQGRISRIREAFPIGPDSLLHSQPEQRTRFEALLVRYFPIFFGEELVGSTSLIEHSIPLEKEDTRPIKSKVRPLNPEELESLRVQIDKWLKADVIEPSNSPWASALVAVPKKGGRGIRWAVDFRRLNDVSRKDSYPIPCIPTIMGKLKGMKVYSSLDQASAFMAVPVKKEDQEKTAFISPLGLYHFKKMPFGLANSPSTYARLIDMCLTGADMRWLSPFIDDLLVATPDIDRHFVALEDALQRLQSAGLKLEPDKCEFFRRETKFLGHLITPDGARPLEDYIQVVRDWPEPKTVSELRSFLGKVNYYNKFFPRLHELAGPLNDLLIRPETEEEKEKFQELMKKYLEKKQAAMDAGLKPPKEPTKPKQWDIDSFWKENHKEAFKGLKAALCSAPVLGFPDWDRNAAPFILDTDFCNHGIGACLSQEQNGKEVVLAYAAKRCKKPASYYGSYRGELYAAAFMIDHFRFFLRSRPFILRSDHKPLTGYHSQETLTAAEQRWIDLLSAYNFKMVHRAGAQHQNADSLSRAPHLQPPEQDRLTEDQTRYDNAFVDLLLKGQKLKIPPEQDPTHNYKLPPQGRSKMVCSVQATTSWLQDLDEQLELKDWKSALLDDFDLQKALHFTMLDTWPSPRMADSFSPTLRAYYNRRDDLDINADGQLCIKGTDRRSWFRCLPRPLWEQAIWYQHRKGSHCGAQKIATRLRMLGYFFPSMEATALKAIQGCPECLAKTLKTPSTVLQPPRPQGAGYPFQKIHIDYVGPFTAVGGHRYLFTVIDSFSRWPEAFTTRDMTAETAVKILSKEVFPRFGSPEVLHSDRAQCFVGEAFQTFLRKKHIEHQVTPSYNPHSNAKIERMHRTLGAALRAVEQKDPLGWKDALPFALWGLRSGIHQSTQVSPFFCLFGREANDNDEALFLGDADGKVPPTRKGSLAWKEEMEHNHSWIRQNLKLAVCRQQRRYRHNLDNQPWTVGEEVFLYTPRLDNPEKSTTQKTAHFWTGPWIITRRVNDVVLELRSNWRHHSNLKVTAGSHRLSRVKAIQNWCLPEEEIPVQGLQITEDDGTTEIEWQQLDRPLTPESPEMEDEEFQPPEESALPEEEAPEEALMQPEPPEDPPVPHTPPPRRTGRERKRPAKLGGQPYTVASVLKKFQFPEVPIDL